MNLRSCLLSLFFVAFSAQAETVFLIGDSTVAEFSAPDPRHGWGQVIQAHFTPEVVVKNFAKSGRSSRSFFDEGLWAPLVPQLQPGDYVFIQFGHNDQKRDAARSTDAWGSYQEFLAKYVDDSLQAGAIPVLMTPVARGGFKNSSRPGSHGNYPEAMLDLAKSKKVLSIDLTMLSEAYIAELGSSETAKMYIWSIDGKDDTHFTPAGARQIAKLVAKAIKGLDTPLAKKVKGLE